MLFCFSDTVNARADAPSVTRHQCTWQSVCSKTGGNVCVVMLFCVADTVNARADAPSVHLTLGVDTHVWDLNYASMRDTALKRKVPIP